MFPTRVVEAEGTFVDFHGRALAISDRKVGMTLKRFRVFGIERQELEKWHRREACFRSFFDRTAHSVGVGQMACKLSNKDTATEEWRTKGK